MGAEYRFNLTEEDFAAFESDIRGRNLDHVLRSVPAFEKAEGSVYYYIAADPEGKWRTMISVDGDGLVVCDYGLARGKNDVVEVIPHLMWAILDVCGRVSIEDY